MLKRTDWQPYLVLYLIAVSLLLWVTLSTYHLSGSDIHIEYYFAKQTITTGWQSNIPNAINSSLAITWLIPIISKITSIPLLYVFKVVVPLVYAIVPLLCYKLFKNVLDDAEAFLAAIFFMLIPTFTVEMPALARQQIASVFFVLIFVVHLSSIRLDYKGAFLAILCVLVVVSHYTLAYLLPIYFFFVISFEVYKRKWDDALMLVGVTIVLFAFGFLYFNNVASGEPLNCVKGIYNTMTNLLPKWTQVPFSVIPTVESAPVLPELPAMPAIPTVATSTAFDYPIRVALGMDFSETTMLGRTYRVLQIVIHVIMAVGVVLMLKASTISYKYKALMVASGSLMVACIAIPGFSMIINASRFYHIAMIILAPALIYPFTKVLLEYFSTVFSIVLLAFYAVFSHGIVFEVESVDSIDTFTIPYSIPMSNERLDVGGYYTPEDIKLAEAIHQKYLSPVYADIHGVLLLQEYYGTDYDAVKVIPYDLTIPDDAYVFLRTYNVQHQTLTFWRGAGLREQISYSELGGKAVLYGKSDTS